MTPFADYVEHREAARRLFQDACESRILLLRAESGFGKTSLLLNFIREQLPASALSIFIQLRVGLSVPEILYRTGSKIGWEHLQSFSKSLVQLHGPTTVKIDSNWLLGMKNNISVVLHADNPDERYSHRELLTTALFADVQAASGPPLIVVFDTYEQATSDVQDWIGGSFMARVVDAHRVRVIIAGQIVPDSLNVDWGLLCTKSELPGITDAADWLPVVSALNRHIPGTDPKTWLAGVCHALKGNPKDIMQVIEGLPMRHSAMAA